MSHADNSHVWFKHMPEWSFFLDFYYMFNPEIIEYTRAPKSIMSGISSIGGVASFLLSGSSFILLIIHKYLFSRCLQDLSTKVNKEVDLECGGNAS